VKHNARALNTVAFALFICVRLYAGDAKSAVDAKMAELKVQLPPPTTISEMNGASFKDKDGKFFTATHLSGVARRELVPIGVNAIPVLLKYMDDDDPKICFIAAEALESITNLYPHGMTMNDMYDVKASGHARLVAAFQEWWARACGTYTQPDSRFEYSCRRAKVAMPTAAQWYEQRHIPIRLSDGKVGILSGANEIKVAIFDPATESIEYRESPLKKAWGSHAIPLPQDRALLLNGELCETYDFRANAYHQIGGEYALGKNSGWASTILPDGRIFFCGGSVERQNAKGCWLFDPKNDSFSKAGELIVARSRHQVTWLASSKILVTGGKTEDLRQPCIDSVEVFDLATGISSLMDTRMIVGRSAHAALRLRDGKVLIAGGFDVTQRHSELDTAEVFDPVVGRSVKVGSMALGRSTGLHGAASKRSCRCFWRSRKRAFD